MKETAGKESIKGSAGVKRYRINLELCGDDQLIDNFIGALDAMAQKGEPNDVANRKSRK